MTFLWSTETGSGSRSLYAWPCRELEEVITSKPRCERRQLYNPSFEVANCDGEQERLAKFLFSHASSFIECFWRRDFQEIRESNHWKGYNHSIPVRRRHVCQDNFFRAEASGVSPRHVSVSTRAVEAKIGGETDQCCHFYLTKMHVGQRVQSDTCIYGIFRSQSCCQFHIVIIVIQALCFYCARPGISACWLSRCGGHGFLGLLQVGSFTWAKTATGMIRGLAEGRYQSFFTGRNSRYISRGFTDATRAGKKKGYVGGKGNRLAALQIYAWSFFVADNQ